MRYKDFQRDEICSSCRNGNVCLHYGHPATEWVNYSFEITCYESCNPVEDNKKDNPNKAVAEGGKK